MQDFIIDPRAITLIREFESFADRVEYPGGMSGPTWGWGYDGAYHTAEEIRADWSGRLSDRDVERLARWAPGNHGSAKAATAVTRLADIRIPRAAADAVFDRVDVPRWIQRTAAAMPGYEFLPDAVQGALVSLVFNRGARMADSNKVIHERSEMRAIRDAVADTKAPIVDRCAEIARMLRSMGRLWTGALPHPYNVKMRGLVRRREAEAVLVDSAVRK